MNFSGILATAEPAANNANFVPVNWMWSNITSLDLLGALMFVSFGAVCVIYGWRVFKILVVISFAMLGMLGGIMISDMLGGTNEILAGGIGLLALAVVSVPLMRYAVSVLGAVAGGILTGAIWHAVGLPPSYIWAGALIGIVAGGMISFIIFKIAIMLFSSLGGAGLIVTGLLALLNLYGQTSEQVRVMVFEHNWFLPVAIVVPTLIGVYMQNRMIKDSPSWSV